MPASFADDAFGPKTTESKKARARENPSSSSFSSIVPRNFSFFTTSTTTNDDDDDGANLNIPGKKNPLSQHKHSSQEDVVVGKSSSESRLLLVVAPPRAAAAAGNHRRRFCRRGLKSSLKESRLLHAPNFFVLDDLVLLKTEERRNNSK